MSTRYEILPASQNAIIADLSCMAGLNFALYGGTAIALRLGHRESVDFDFFSNTAINPEALKRALPILTDATVIQDEKDTWTVLVYPLGEHERPVKLSFFGNLPFGRVGTPTYTDQGELALASSYDLFGHKLKVLLQRVEAKDYQDIAAMLRSGLQLERGLGASIALFGANFPAAEALRALTYFKDGDLSRLSKSDRQTLIDAVSKVGRPLATSIISQNLIPNPTDRDHGVAKAHLAFREAFARCDDQTRGLLHFILAVTVSVDFTNRDTTALSTLAPANMAPLVQQVIALALRSKNGPSDADQNLIDIVKTAPKFSVSEQTAKAIKSAGGSDKLTTLIEQTLLEEKARGR